MAKSLKTPKLPPGEIATELTSPTFKLKITSLNCGAQPSLLITRAETVATLWSRSGFFLISPRICWGVLAFFASADGIVNFNISTRFLKEITCLEALVCYQYQTMMEQDFSLIP